MLYRLQVVRVALAVVALTMAVVTLPMAPSPVSAAGPSAPSQSASSHAKRHVIRHRPLSRAAASTANRIRLQTPASASSAPVVGGTWSEIGPKPVASVGAPEGEVSGRVTAIAVDPKTSGATVYLGTADGGVWKTTNGTSGSPTWTPIFDTQLTLAIGAIAIDPSNTSTIYVGTGEPDDCYDCLPSQGVFKSTDGGTTWALLSGSPVHRTTAIVIDRSNSQHVLVATTKGLWASTDGGSTWAQNTQIASVTYPITSGGTASGGMDALVQDPVNASVYWAAMADWCDTEGGSIVKSTDSGTTWAESTHFPTITPPATRISLALGKDSTNHVVAYAALASCSSQNPVEGDGQLLGIGKNSDADGSGSWTVIQPSGSLPDFFQEPGTPASWQGWYDNMAAVDPTNPSVAIFGGVTLLLTTDGGVSFTDIARPYSSSSTSPALLHPDFHAAVYTTGSTFYVGNDGGAWYTTNDGTSYTNLNHTLGLTQLYAGSSLNSSYLIGGSQDNGTVGLVPGGPASPTWKQLLDGDGGWTAIDPTSGSKVVWGEQTNLDLYRGTYDTAGSSWSETGPCGTAGCKENTDFIAPFLMDSKNPSILYAGSTFAYRTTNSGGAWTASPDLTFASTTHSDDFIHTMAETTGSSSTALLTGSKYGRAFMMLAANSTSNWSSATAWTEITGNLPAYNASMDTGNPWISGLAVNPTNPSEAWATISVGSGARVFHTLNAGAAGGTSWTDITGIGATAVPDVVVDSIAVDPQHPQTIFIGTDAGAMICGTCGGATAVGTWAPLGSGLPNVRVDAITVTADDATIVAWTHGRDVWTLSNSPRATLQPTSLNFGNQTVGTASSAQGVTVTDQGTMPLIVTGITTSGDYSQTNNCATVLPGSSCTIKVTFTPTAIGTRNGTLTVSDNATNSPQTATLTGNGTPAPSAYGSLSPTAVSFGNQEVGTTSAPQPVTLTNSGNMAMTITNISTSSNFGQSNNCGSSLAAGGSCQINVTFSPSSTGSQSGTLTVKDNATNNPQTASLSGTGVQAKASLTPNSLTFGPQHVGTTSSGQPVTLSNTGNEAMTITSITTSGDFGQTNNCGSSLATNGSCTITVTFTPTAMGSRSGSLSVADSAPGSPQTASLSGTGTEAQASLSPTSLSFGNQQVSTTSSAQNVTLSNSGNEALSISGIATNGDFAQTNTCGTTLAAGGKCTISVTFTPTATGSRTGTLTVSDSAPGSPQSAVLSGTGTQPQVSLSPTSLAFSAEDINTTSGPQPVTLTNNGNQALSINSISASGDFAQSNDCGSSVAAGAHCTINVTFTPTSAGNRPGSLAINDNAPGNPQTVPLSGQGLLRFYFAEGFTASGFDETLSILVPNHNGTATIDYYTPTGQKTVTRTLTAGQVWTESVNNDVPNQQVSARVTLDAMGVVERTIHFNFGSWHGSTDKVGVTQPKTEWDFAEGSTLSFFNEYLTLQNPNPNPVTVILNYVTGNGSAIQKTVTLPASSRTTVQVFADTPSPETCSVSNGTAVGCGVGPGIGGVSVQVLSQGLPIIAERPFYVNGHDFGSGSINDGHDAFGANGPAMEWNFAEGTTLPGFNEYLTLQNPSASNSTVDIHYFDQMANEVTKTVRLPAHSRTTIEVFNGSFTTGTCSVVNGTGVGCGVGSGIQGVAVQVAVQAGSPGIVVERPIYIVHDFGSGAVHGAEDIVGATQLAQQFGFAWASTASGENDFLTIENPGTVAATVTITYYGASGQLGSTLTVSVGAHLRQTIQLWDGSPSGGVGPGQQAVGIIMSSSRPVQVEKPTYSANSGTYGATDTSAFTPSSF